MIPERSDGKPVQGGGSSFVSCPSCGRSAVIVGSHRRNYAGGLLRRLLSDLERLSENELDGLKELLERVDDRESAQGWKALALAGEKVPAVVTVVERAEKNRAGPKEVGVFILTAIGFLASVQQMAGEESLADLVKTLVELIGV